MSRKLWPLAAIALAALDQRLRFERTCRNR